MGNKNKDDYDDMYNYGISKLCSLLHSRILDLKYNKNNENNESNGIIAVSIHPGTIQTGLFTHMSKSSFLKLVNLSFFLNPQYYWEEFKSIEQGAATTLRCISMTNNEIKSGHWYFNCRSGDDRNRLHKTAKQDKIRYNNQLAQKLDQLKRFMSYTCYFK